MKTKPILFRFTSLAFFCIGISIPIQVMVQYQHAPWEILAIYTKLTPVNLLLMVTSLICAWATSWGSRSALVAVPIFVGALLWNNLAFWGISANYSSQWAVAGIVAGFALGLLLGTRSYRSIFRDPSLRWWRVAPRHRVDLPAMVFPVTGGDVSVRIFDLSKTGAFLAEDTIRWVTPSGTTIPNQIKMGTRCQIRLLFGSANTVTLNCEIVRKADARGLYPSGFAIRFVEMGLGMQRQLNRLMERRVVELG